MSMAKKRANATLFAIVAALCLCAGMIFGGGYVFAKAEDDASAPEPSTYTAIIDPTNTGFQAASAVEQWKKEFDWQWMNIGGGEILSINFTQQIDAEKYGVATFKALNWAGGDYITVELLKNDDTKIEEVSLRRHESSDAVAKNDISYFTIDLSKYKNAENKVTGIKMRVPSDFAGHLVISNFTCYTDAVAVIDAKEFGMKNAAIDPGASLNWGSLFNAQSAQVASATTQTVKFVKPVTVNAEHKYAIFNAMFWDGSSWVKTAVTANGNTDVSENVYILQGGAGDMTEDNVKVVLPLENLSDEKDGIESLTFTYSVPTGWSGIFIISDFELVAQIPADFVHEAGEINYKVSGFQTAHTVPAWATAFNYEILNVANNEFEFVFYDAIDTNAHYAATFDILAWAGANRNLILKKSDGTEVRTVTVRGHGDVTALDQKATVALRLSDFAVNGKAESIKLQFTDMAASDEHVIFTNLTCHEIPESTEGKISGPLSHLNAVHTVEAWKEYFDYETKQDTAPKTFTVEFIEPIEITHKYAVFNAMFWGGATWKNVTITANGNSSASENVWIVQGYNEAYGSEKVLLPLEKFKTGDNMLHSITFSCDSLGSNAYQGFLLISELLFTDTLPAELVTEPGDIDYRRSGLIKTSEKSPVAFWKDLFDYQTSATKGGKLKIIFAEPIDASEYSYAVFNALLWGVPGFIDVPVTTPDGSTTLSVYSYWAGTASEINADNMLARLELKGLADSNGKISELTFDFSNVSDDGNEFSGWFLFENFNCVNMQVGTAQYKKDISSLMPIGESKSFTAAISGEEGEWTKHAFARTAAYDALEFEFAATYGEHFKFGMLVRTLRPADTVSKSGKFDGVLIEFTEAGAKISAWNGDELVSASKRVNLFASGESVKIKLEILETTLMDTPCGYTLRLTVGDVVLDDIFSDTQGITFGYYTHVLTANAGEAFTATVSSASEAPESAAEFMNVKLSATATDGATKRVPLKFTYNDIGNVEVSAPIVNGAAHYDAVGGYLVFDGEGEVTVKYSVTNEFGTFESNTLTLNYTAPKDKAEVAQEKGCGGVVGFECALAAVVLLGLSAAVMVLRKKKA